MSRPVPPPTSYRVVTGGLGLLGSLLAGPLMGPPPL
jgi:hypothetical protein